MCCIGYCGLCDVCCGSGCVMKVNVLCEVFLFGLL